MKVIDAEMGTDECDKSDSMSSADTTEQSTDWLSGKQRDSTEKVSDKMAESCFHQEIPVWFNGKKRWITGLSKRTTCDDVVYALICHVTSCWEPTRLHNYIIFEGWKGVERPLKGRTKIIKVWKAWGDEQTDVQLTLRRMPSSVPQVCSSHRTRKSRRMKYCEQCRRHGFTSSASSDESVSTRGRCDRSDMKMLYKLVNVIIDQEKRLKKIAKKMKTTDAEIKSFEDKSVMVPTVSGGDELTCSPETSMFPAVKTNDLETYLHILENIFQIETMISEAHEKAYKLSRNISEEKQCDEKEELDDLGNRIVEIKQQLEKCHSVSTQQQRHLEWMTRALTDYDKLLKEKYKRLLALEKQCDELDALNSQVPGSRLSKISGLARVQRMVTDTGILPPIPETANSSANSLKVKDNESSEAPEAIMNNPVIGIKPVQETSNLDPVPGIENNINNIRSIVVQPPQDVIKADLPAAGRDQYLSGFLKVPQSDTDSASDTGISSLHSGEEGHPVLDTLV